MDILSLFSELNYLAILVATIVSYALGALWYSPYMFLDAWMEDTAAQRSAKPGMAMLPLQAINLVAQFISVSVFAVILSLTNTVANAVNLSIIVAILFLAASAIKFYTHESRSWRLFLINSGYDVVVLLVAAFVIASWR